MATSSIPRCSLRGVSAAVPSNRQGVDSYSEVFGLEESAKISKSVGVVERRIAPPGVCTSDLCHAAAGRLLSDLAWAPETVEALVFITQTPDYVLPATSCALQHRLGLAKSCLTFDVNLGCSGFTHGLWLAASMIQGGGLRRVLILAGDTISRISSPEDRSVLPLFGDAGTAAALEAAPDSSEVAHFVLGSDGSGERKLVVKCGGFRNPRTPESGIRSEREGGNIRSDEDLYMEGAEIFAFTLREIPNLVQQTLSLGGMAMGDLDHVICHQANKFMLQHLAKRMKIPPEKFTLGLESFGNTSSASIPLAMVTELRHTLRTESKRLLLAGFGVGFSWSTALLKTNNLVIPELIVV